VIGPEGFIGDLYLPLSGAQALARLNGLGAAGAAFTDSVFAIKGSSDATKLAVFEVDGFTTATTRTFTLPNATTTLAGLAVAQTFSAAQTMSSTLTLSDRVGLGSLSTGAMLNIASNTLSATTERAILMAFTGTSAATTSLRGLQVSLTGASATTHTTVIGYQMSTPTPGGSGGAFTSLYGFSCTDAVAGTATNVAGFFYGDTAPTAGNWAFYNSTTRASHLGGTLSVGSNSLATWTDSTHTPQLQVVGTGESGSALGAIRFSTGSVPARVLLGKSRGAVGVYTIVTDNELLGRVEAQGADGTDLSSAAYIDFVVDGTPAAGSIPGEITFTTKPAGGALTNRMAISSAGNIVAGTQAALATNATDGFLYIPTCAGTPTGVPTAYTGKVALVFDTTNNELYVYDGGWISTTAFA
jgi:hypothetical protein